MFVLETVNEPTALESLFTNSSSVISKMVNWLGQISTGLIGNTIFQIMIGIAMLFILIGIVFKLVKKMRKGGR